ncbi:MAG: putative LPS assembly protein LptD [Bacteroidota bacterium]
MQHFYYILTVIPRKEKFRKKVITLFAISFIFLSGLSAQVNPTAKKDTAQSSTTPNSTVPSFINGGGIPGLDSLVQDTSKKDTLSPADAKKQQYVDSLKATSDLDAEVKYTASDSIVFDVKSKKLFLYQNSTLDYTDINLKSKRLDISMDNQTLHAFGKEDSTRGTYEGRPEFTQAGETYQAKDIVYNFATRKGRIKNGKLVEGDGFVLAEVAKYQQDGTFHGYFGKYTTCNLDHPHYYIQSRKLKMIPDKKQLISGPLNLVIGDFPIPIVIPFGFLPNMESEGRKNGIIFPTYGEAQDRGFFLRNLGYYVGLNDYFDLQVDGDIYTRGGWRLGVATKYNIKYRFSGNLRFQYGVQRFNEPTDPDFRRTTAWSLTWSHNQPIDPTFRISSSVNMSSSNSFQRRISQNQSDFFTNNLTSSVNISKNFNNLPFSLNVGLRHQQDLNKETVSMQLPELAFNVQRQTPFKFVKNKNLRWLKTLGITYNMNARNSLETVPDTLLGTLLFNWQDSIDYFEVFAGDTIPTRRVGSSFYRNGMQHRLSSGTTIKLFKNINITPSFSSIGYWYTSTTEKFWNEAENRIEDRQVRGFAQGYEYSTSVSASTNFYGIYELTSTKRELKFRQRFSPSIGYNYRPDFSEDRFGYYRTVQADSAATRFETYSIFEDGIYRGPGKGESQSMSFSLSSVIEMKYRKKESFEDDFDEKEDKYIRTNLIDNIGLSGSYNFAADSFQLSTINARVRTSLFEKKLNITTSARLDPYYYGFDDTDTPFELPNARRINDFLINRTGQLARLTAAQVSLSTSLSSKKRNGTKSKSKDFDEQEFQQIANTLYQYVDFDIPWSLRLNYNLSYSRPGIDPGRLTSTANISGSFSFTPNWQFQFQTGYDLVNRKANQTRLSVFRNLHCWDMSFSWVPFGPLRSYNLTIAVRSATLRDLKLTRNNFWQDRF